MIVIEKDITDAKNRLWYLYNNKKDKVKEIQKLRLVTSSLTNNFNIVKDLVDDINANHPKFSKWLETFLCSYIKQEYNVDIVTDQIDNLLMHSSKYVKAQGIDFSVYFDKSKTTKTSIAFDAEDIECIVTLSVALKIYGIISCDEKMRLPDNIHVSTLETISKNVKKRGLKNKIFKLVCSLTYRTVMRDKYIWDFCKLRGTDAPDSHIMGVFNYIISNLISILEIDKNPIPFIKNTVENSIRWLMKSVHNNDVIYGETFFGPEDIYSSGSNSQHSFDIYCCSDLIGKCAKSGMDILSNQYGLSDDKYDEIRDRLDEVDDIYPHVKLVTLPIFSKVFNINYKHLLKMPPEHTILTGVLLKELSEGILADRFPHTMSLLTACPTSMQKYVNIIKEVNGEELIDSRRNMTMKSSYTIRSPEYILNDNKRMFGFKLPLVRFKALSAIIGVLIAVRRNLVNIHDGSPLKKVSNNILEQELTTYFSLLYNGELASSFAQMLEKVENEYL